MSLTELERAERWADEHRAVLREAGDHWVATGEWLTVTELGRSALRREDKKDVFAALRNLPPALGRIEQPQDTVILRVRALAMTPAAEPFLHEYIRVFWLATLRLKADDDDLEVRDTDLIDALGLSPEFAERVSQLVLAEDWMYGGGSGSADNGWSRTINEHTRAVMTVKSVEDYIALEGQRFWMRPAAVPSQAMPDTSASGYETDAALSDGRRGVPGVAVDELHPLIAAATAKLLANRHYDEAVLAGALALRNILREASGHVDLDGTDLAGAALGGTPPPIVVADPNSTSGKGQQNGWRLLAQGCFLALRNPVAHERGVHQDRISAMEALATMSLVARRVTEAAS